MISAILTNPDEETSTWSVWTVPLFGFLLSDITSPAPFPAIQISLECSFFKCLVRDRGWYVRGQSGHFTLATANAPLQVARWPFKSVLYVRQRGHREHFFRWIDNACLVKCLHLGHSLLFLFLSIVTFLMWTQWSPREEWTEKKEREWNAKNAWCNPPHLFPYIST